MDIQQILLVPHDVVGAAGLRADVVLAQHPAGGQDQREAAGGALAGRHVLGEEELALAAHELVHVHRRRALGRGIVARPLDAAQAIELLVADAGEGRRQARDLVHDFGRMPVVHRIAERLRQQHGDLPVLIARLGRHDLAHPRDAPLGVGERAVLLEEGRARQEHVRELRRLVQEQVLNDDALQRLHGACDVMRVGVRLDEVLALHVHGPEGAIERRLEHVR